MDKRKRHAAILDLVEDRPVGSQEELRGFLRERGWDVTQSTLSRDLRELRLARVPTPDGVRYAVADGALSSAARPALDILLPAVAHARRRRRRAHRASHRPRRRATGRVRARRRVMARRARHRWRRRYDSRRLPLVGGARTDRAAAAQARGDLDARLAACRRAPYRPAPGLGPDGSRLHVRATLTVPTQLVNYAGHLNSYFLERS